MHQELRLASPLPVRVLVRVEPVPAIHHTPVDVIQIGQVVVEAREWYHVSVSIREDPPEATLRYCFHTCHQVYHAHLAALITFYESMMNSIQHRRARGEVERNIIADGAKRWERHSPIHAALLDMPMTNMDDTRLLGIAIAYQTAP